MKDIEEKNKKYMSSEKELSKDLDSLKILNKNLLDQRVDITSENKKLSKNILDNKNKIKSINTITSFEM